MKKAKPATILLVEDNRGDQELTRRALGEGQIRNELRIVEDGEEAPKMGLCFEVKVP